MNLETQNLEQEALVLKVINKVKMVSKNNVLLTKHEVKKVSSKLWNILVQKNLTHQYESRLEKMFLKKNQEYLSVYNTLNEMVPYLVKVTVKLYEKGHLASIFSEDEMTALAHQKILDVLSQYRKGLVDMKGLKSYFKTAFKNHSQKVYEAHNGTDIRGGIRTISSDEAMNVAINLNKYSPEKQYVINDTMNFIIEKLQYADLEYNERVQRFNKDSNHRQKYAGIILGLLRGNTAEESCAELGLTNSDFLRQKRMSFEYLKKELPAQLKDIFSEFEVEEDKRVHVQCVEKRNRRGKENNSFKESFILKEKPVGKNSSEISLIACINMVDLNGTLLSPPKLSNLISFKQIVLETKKTNKNNYAKIKNNLLDLSKTDIIKAQVKKEGEAFYKEYSEKLAHFYNNKKENAA